LPELVVVEMVLPLILIAPGRISLVHISCLFVELGLVKQKSDVASIAQCSILVAPFVVVFVGLPLLSKVTVVIPIGHFWHETLSASDSAS
jgi:hypothetical protein